LRGIGRRGAAQILLRRAAAAPIFRNRLSHGTGTGGSGSGSGSGAFI